MPWHELFFAGIPVEEGLKEKDTEADRASRLWTTVILRVLLIVAAIVAAILVLYSLRTVLLLLVLSVFFCYLIAPIVRLFEQPLYLLNRELKLPRGIAIILVYILIGGTVFLASQVILPILGQQITALGKELPSYFSQGAASARKWLEGADGWLRRLKLPAQSQDYLLTRLTEATEALFPWIRDELFSLLGYLVYLPWMVLVPILSFFMLKDAEQFSKEVVSLMPSARLQRRANRLLLDISQTLAGYIRSQITGCIVVGAISTAGFVIIGVPYAVVIGALAGVLEFIPLVGPLIAMAIAFFLSLITSVKTAIVVLLFLAVLRLVEDYIIYPRIVRVGVKMHPLLVVLAVLCGAELDGVVGIFLAIPVVGLFIVGYNHYLGYRRSVILGIPTGDLVIPPGTESNPAD
jgi:predicted PurR-regulated permease PerM